MLLKLWILLIVSNSSTLVEASQWAVGGLGFTEQEAIEEVLQNQD